MDREWIEAWRRNPGAENLRPLVERYQALVYSAAYRRTGNEGDAREVTRALFLVLTRRARKLRKNAALAGWFFRVTALACRKLNRKPRGSGWWRWFKRTPQNELPPEETLWSRVAPEIDLAIDRLSAARRDAVLLAVMLNRDGNPWPGLSARVRGA
jgi:DNA-directed RNA polymerase specialized sigma24 family protein